MLYLGYFKAHLLFSSTVYGVEMCMVARSHYPDWCLDLSRAGTVDRAPSCSRYHRGKKCLCSYASEIVLKLLKRSWEAGLTLQPEDPCSESTGYGFKMRYTVFQIQLTWVWLSCTGSGVSQGPLWVPGVRLLSGNNKYPVGLLQD